MLVPQSIRIKQFLLLWVTVIQSTDIQPSLHT